ncbi:hypothetical protein [Methylomonas sp. DH-1]|uniref:hypothetical protein n=1 Tax=Methylomonas sp. (strain DH-1) TaxID=1727196 RepID=UPI0007C8FD94|nr:hypothetical protein [Methylomonas sp. DH-1]ANE55919.1 hypothetical protein AYM39_12505 [Methylomonas sp. DH-1]
MKRNYSIIDPDGRLLSRLDIKPTGDGHELDVSFDSNFRRALTVKKLGQARNTHDMLRQAFPERAFVVVQISQRRGQYVVDVPGEDPPAWMAKAIESLGGVLTA